jgi:hypothetical protein
MCVRVALTNRRLASNRIHGLPCRISVNHIPVWVLWRRRHYANRLVLQEPIDDPELRRRVAAYLADQQAITIRYHQARTLDEKNTALQDLLNHADTHSQLIDEVIKYQTDHGNFAKPPAIAAATSDDEPPTTPTEHRSSRTRKPKQ